MPDVPDPAQSERVWCLGCFTVRDLDTERRCVECGAQVKSVSWWTRTLPSAAASDQKQEGSDG